MTANVKNPNSKGKQTSTGTTKSGAQKSKTSNTNPPSDKPTGAAPATAGTGGTTPTQKDNTVSPSKSKTRDIPGLIAELSKATTIRDRKRLRRELRQLGHKGGLRKRKEKSPAAK